MQGEVVFSYREFTSRFPEITTTENQAQYAFEYATLLLNNSPCSIVECVRKRSVLLYLLTAHILCLQNRGASNVGSISNASEGSVSVGFAGLGQLGQNYFGQTQYGLLFWQAVRKYMSGFYVPEC